MGFFCGVARGFEGCGMQNSGAARGSKPGLTGGREIVKYFDKILHEKIGVNAGLRRALSLSCCPMSHLRQTKRGLVQIKRAIVEIKRAIVRIKRAIVFCKEGRQGRVKGR